MAGTTIRPNRGKLLLLLPVVLFGVLCLLADPALSENSPTPPVPPTPSSTVKLKVEDLITKNAGIRNRVQVKIQNLAEAIEKDRINPRKLALYLDGRVMPGIYAERIGDPTENVLEFFLERTDKSKQSWLPLLGSPTSAIRAVTVSVGYEDKEQIPAVDPNELPKLNLRVFHFAWFVGCTIGLVVLVVVCFWLAHTTDLLRDSSTLMDLGGKTVRLPYSLARFQMAVWFFLVVSSYVYIYLITGDYDTITAQALTLMGIGSGTALVAAAIDAGKRSVVKREQETCAGLTAKIDDIQGRIAPADAGGTKPDTKALTDKLIEMKGSKAEVEKKLENAQRALVNYGSKCFLMDVLSDDNGVNFHRFQMLVWTAILVFLFIIEVYKNLAMPEFSPTLLALMGISSGTYLGFKIPEAQRR